MSPDNNDKQSLSRKFCLFTKKIKRKQPGLHIQKQKKKALNTCPAFIWSSKNVFEIKKKQKTSFFFDKK